jgi:hypothetical protein
LLVVEAPFWDILATPSNNVNAGALLIGVILAKIKEMSQTSFLIEDFSVNVIY